jgi:hypothetical protein
LTLRSESWGNTGGAVLEAWPAARGRLCPSLVAFFRPFSIYPVEAAHSRPKPEALMANILHLQLTHRPILAGVTAKVRAVARAVAAEHALSLRAATKATSPHQRLAEVRAMYVPSANSHQGSDAVAPSDCAERP